MFPRAISWVLVGWLLLAAVAGLAAPLGLTLALPSTTAIVLVHAAFFRPTRDAGLPYGLAIAVVLGYLEDLHQGAPTGVLCLAHALAYVVLHWASGRLALPGIPARAAAAAVTVALIDLLTFATLFGFAEQLELRRETLVVGLQGMHWRMLVTAVAAHPVWMALDLLFTRLGIGEAQSQPGTRAVAGGRTTTEEG
jgi:cell shape-determining protein MreD